MKQGLIFLPLWAPTLVAPLIGHLSDKHGSRLYATLGLLLCGLCFTSLQLITHHSVTQELLLCLLLALIGLAFTMIMAPLMADMNAAVSAKEAERPGVFGHGGATAQVNGFYSSAFAAGLLIGPVSSGFLKDRFGWTPMCWCLGSVSFLTAPLVFLWVEGARGKSGGFSRRSSVLSTEEAISRN